ncbi:hypothetical protein CDAR_429901 [Caerostris darwini]|uniref:Uncharacterized protein n=1 Tax=Caerostris darwini TaxID=1538125 RepID=A0AAV4WDE0_9ARAC|nr:hypothetical protein CDAR_429901 [Caerostris darwini]
MSMTHAPVRMTRENSDFPAGSEAARFLPPPQVSRSSAAAVEAAAPDGACAPPRSILPCDRMPRRQSWLDIARRHGNRFRHSQTPLCP